MAALTGAVGRPRLTQLMISAGWSAWGEQQGVGLAGGGVGGVGDDLAVVVDRGPFRAANRCTGKARSHGADQTSSSTAPRTARSTVRQSTSKRPGSCCPAPADLSHFAVADWPWCVTGTGEFSLDDAAEMPRAVRGRACGMMSVARSSGVAPLR